MPSIYGAVLIEPMWSYQC